MTPRLTTEFWIDAYRMRLRQNDIAVFVVAKGDPTAGAVLVKQSPLNGQATLYQRTYDLDGNRVWAVLAEGAEADVDAAITRQRSFDPDLWVLEVEDKEGRHLLDDPSLAS